MSGRRFISMVFAAVVFSALSLSPAARAAPAPSKAKPAAATGKAGAAEAKKPTTPLSRREKMLGYYLQSYKRTLKRTDWITRAMGVLGLAKIDDPRVTEILLEVMEGRYAADAVKEMKDRAAKFRGKLTTKQRIQTLGASPHKGLTASAIEADSALWQLGSNVVQLMAWEAIHARTGSLTKAQRKRWIAGTTAMARRGLFHGDMRMTMLKVLAPQGPTRENREMFGKLFYKTNALDPRDSEVLRAMRRILADWRSAPLAKALISTIGAGLNDAPRADYLLRGLGTDIPQPKKHADKGTIWLWPTMRKAWTQWYNKGGVKDSPGGSPRPYRGTSSIVPPPRPLDPDDQESRKDLELPRLHVNQLDVTFVIDTTGSMRPVVNWIKRDIRKMLIAFSLLSREPRIGVVLYRDHGDAYVTSITPLEASTNRLLWSVYSITAAGGGDVPEAVLDGLVEALLKQKWSQGSYAHRVLILVGDAPPHKKDMKAIERLVKAAAAKGLVLYCIKARTKLGSKDLSSFDRIAEWGKGKSIWMDFTDEKAQKDLYEGAQSVHVVAETGAEPLPRPDRVILREVTRSILGEDYADRADPFANVLLEYLERSVKEKRKKILSPMEKKIEAARRAAARKRRGKGKGKGRGGGFRPAPKGPQDR